MTAPAWATDLNDIWIDPTSTSGFTATGGGAAALSADTDFYIQGGATTKSCLSKAAWTNAIKGFIYSAGTFSVPADGAIVAWGVYFASASLQVRNPGANQPGGLMIIVGSGTGDYNRFNVAGSDTLIYDSWIPFVVNPDNSLHDGGVVGSPSATESYVGIEANLPTTAGPTKGNPLGQDAVRYGRHRLEYTFGEAGNYNTFAGSEGWANALARRLGNIELARGVYRVQGFHSFGTAGTSVQFVDSNKVLLIRTAYHVTSAYNRFQVFNAGSNVTMDNVVIISLNTVSPGTWVTTAGTLMLTNCQFVDMNTFSFLASSTVTSCIFRRCKAVTAPGANLTGSQFLTSTVAADASALVWDVNTDLDGKIDNCIFSKGTNAHHAITLGSNSPTNITIRKVTFSGFSTSDGQNDSVLLLDDKGSDQTWTIGCVGCTGTVTYKKVRSGDTVNITQGVALSVHVQDANTGGSITGARVLAEAAAGGPYPYQASVSIVSSGGTATVTHSSHGLATGDKVHIAGAIEGEYNGIFTITVTGGGTYTYTISGSPASPATGSPISTFVIIADTTDESGNISDTRTYGSNQPFTGRARKASASPFYKTGPFSGTVDSSTGATVTVQMVSDE